MWVTHLVHYSDWLRSESVGQRKWTLVDFHWKLLVVFGVSCCELGVVGFWRVDYHGSSVVELSEAS